MLGEGGQGCRVMDADMASLYGGNPYFMGVVPIIWGVVPSSEACMQRKQACIAHTWLLKIEI
jgi:hypothetical protein